MTKPAFAALGFGAWSRVLVGQVNRGHYRVVFNDQNQVVGFLGWALTNEANAEAWYRGSGTFSDAHAGAGDCVVFNAWAADNGEINRLILHAAREVVSKHRLIYFKRYYPNGSTRPVRMGVNEFVKSHVAHNAARVTVQATVPPPRHGMNAASNGLAATVGHFQGARPGGRQRKFIQEGST